MLLSPEGLAFVFHHVLKGHELQMDQGTCPSLRLRAVYFIPTRFLGGPVAVMKL